MKKIILLLLCLISIFNLQAQTTITIGSGSNSTGTNESSPINIWFKSHHCQILYTPTDLNTAGWTGAGEITKLGFNIFGTTSEGLPNFSIKLKNTTSNDLNTYDGLGLNSVFTSSLYSPITSGFELLTLDNSFVWDGTSNLLVDVCFDQVSNYSSTGQVYTYTYTTSGASQYQYGRADNTPQCGLSTTASNLVSKPQLQLVLNMLPPCTGSPIAGDAVSSNTLICANTSFNLNLINNSVASGLKFQWQSSPDGTTWANLGPIQNSCLNLINSITATTYYRCITTCTASAQSTTSSPIVVNLNPLMSCYCTPSWPNYMVDCTQDRIADFSIANVISQGTNCDSYGFSDSTISNYTSINLTAGNTYTLITNTILSGSTGDGAVGAWIDYNQNSVFDSNEFISLGFGSAGTYSNTFFVPITAIGGSVRVRIMLDAYYAYSGTVLNPCSNNPGSLGQILDYKVNITGAPACSGAPNAGNAVSTLTVVCQNVSYTLDLTNNSVASGVTYQWQSSSDGGATWTNLGSAQNTVPYSIASQNAATYYRCITTCTNGGLSDTSTPVMVSQNLPTACYCSPGMIYCSSVAFYNVSIANLNYSPTCNYVNGYTNYVDSVPAINLTAGQTYNLLTAITTFSSSPDGHVSAWIDYDQNGVFDSSEFISVASYTTGSVSQSINLPFTVPGGNTRMRIKVEESWSNYPGADPCMVNGSNGQTLDYLVNITPSTPCSGTPNAGDATASLSNICDNTPFTLDLINNDIVSNLTYQWQSSSDNAIWTNFGFSQTGVPYIVSNQSITSYYRCVTTCTTSALSGTSTSFVVTQNPLIACFCTPPPADCFSGDEINNVVFSTLSNTSTCSTDGYEDYSGSVASATVNAGQSYTIATTVGSDYNGKVSAWIDYNQNGIFESTEYTFLGITNSIGNYTVNNSINIPGNAFLGDTKMRIRNNHQFPFDSTQACVTGAMAGKSSTAGPSIGLGETEDYLITILPPDCGSINFPPSISITGTTSICSGDSTLLGLSMVLPIATGITYQWKSFNGITFVNDGLASNTSMFTATPSITTLYYCEILCNGSTVLISDTVFVKVNVITTSPITTSVSCNGICNGSIILNASSPGTTLTYSWTPSSVGTSDTINALCAGVYTIDISNTTGCFVTESITITEPTAIIATPTQTNASCFGLSDGSASITIVGGTSPLSYSWSPTGGNALTANNLGAGNYTFNIVDGNNCIVNQPITITEPTALIVTSTQTNVSCFGLNDGIISVIASGGTSPYSYSWSPSGGIIDTEINLTAGTYTYLVSDNNLCSVTQTITILEPTIISATSTQTDVSCFGLSNGAVSLTVSGGASSYSYNWSPNIGTTASVSGIAANNYICVITDINSCSITKTVTITEPTAIIATPTQTDISCFGLNDGIASVTIVGGISPLSFSWSPTGGTGLTATNLSVGNYTFNIVDGNNCTLNEIFTITQPGAISVSISGINSICEQLEDTIKSTIIGGTGPFSYSWLELPVNMVSNDADYIYTTSIGTYSYNLSVTDANNCIVNSNTISVTVNPSSNISGIVTTNTILPVSGMVILYKYLPFYTKFDSVASQDIGAAGDYNFSSFTSGIYILKAIPTSTVLQIAYGDTAVNWKTAKQIIHGCAVNDVQNINVKALSTFTTTGTGSLSGTITQGNGFVPRMGNGFKPMFPGQPIGGIIVKGGRNPGGQMFVQTTTDIDGHYTLSGLPLNTIGTDEYFILVDIPGLDTNGTYYETITLINNQYTGLDFIVDSAKINPIPNSVNSVHDISAIEHQIKVFPNPAYNKVTIQYNLLENSNVKIELFDILGKSVKVLLPTTQQGIDTYKTSWQLEDLKYGLYFIKMNIDGSESTIKLSVSN